MVDVAKNEVVGNLVWIDLEMTGLNVETDVILEIALIITDGNLEVIMQGPSFVINQPEEKLLAMDKWCTSHHKKSGLTSAVLASTTSLDDAYRQTLAFVQQHCPPKTGILSGNTIGQDRNFLAKYMPKIIEHLHYRIIDVTTIKELVVRWYAQDKNSEYKKADCHRALNDVLESIAELKHYRKYFFI